MTITAVDASQHTAAKVVGAAYLLAVVTAAFSEFYVRGRLVVPGDAAETARNILADERLFRLGIGAYLITLLIDVALITALYVVLRSVDPNLALFAAFMRVVETAVLVAAILGSFETLRLLSGAEYLQALRADQLQALARIPISTYRDANAVGSVFLGIGSAVFGYLWLRSNYIPGALAALGIVGSALYATGAFVLIIFPDVPTVTYVGSIVPLGIFEVLMGFWLLLKGLRPP